MTQTIPSKPDYLSDDEYRFILQREHRQCALRDSCNRDGRLGVLEYCDQALDFDHAQPRILGGDNSFNNLRLLCASENRGRAIEPTDYWAAPNYWDGRFNAERLRAVQAMAGYLRIIDDPLLGRAVTEFRDVLLQTTTLMVGATGIGKAITLFSVLFAINSVVNARGPGRPRAHRVLWLTLETSLRDMTRRDLEDDPYNLGLVDARPTVRPAKSYNDILKGPCNADIIVACPQSLWEKSGGGRTDDEKRAALARYDVVVFDECDFANDQLQNLSVLARHALKFALTASPPLMGDADRTKQANFLSRFVLLAEDAVAGYTSAINFDGCLKVMPKGKDSFKTIAIHDGFEVFIRGGRDLVKSGKADPSHPVYLAAITQAIMDADREEQEMKELMPEDWYSPHVIVRLDRIPDVKALELTLPDSIRRLYDLGIISGPGWSVCSVYQDHDRYCSSEDRDLAAKSGDEWLHPFLRAKNQRGRADGKSKRVLLMINIALRGLNNWPIQFVVDCSSRTGTAEETQFQGRGIRLPPHLAKYWGQGGLLRFITTTTYIPESAATDDKVATLLETSRFLHGMAPIISGAGFKTWGDITRTGSLDQAVPPTFDFTAQPLTEEDKIALKVGLGRIVNQAPEPETFKAENLRPAISDLVDRLKPRAEGRRRERAIEFATDLIEKPGFRAEETFAPDQRHRVRIEPVRVTTHLKPKEAYEPDELVRKVESDPRYAPHRFEIKERLQAGDPVYVWMISQNVRADDRVSYREPPRVFKLNAEPKSDGALSGIHAELATALVQCGEIAWQQYGDVARAVYSAAKELFGVENAENDGPLDQHAYHVEIMGRQRSRIKRIALGILAEWGVVQNIAALGRLS